jgi:hypothetical protein
MQRNIIQANIDRFKLLLKTETDPTKRAMEIRLLAEEEAKLMPKPENKEPESKEPEASMGANGLLALWEAGLNGAKNDHPVNA